jgi:hypothetical protein
MRRVCLLVTLGCAGWVGCRFGGQQPPYANDPLLQQRKPVYAQPTDKPTLPPPLPEPSPPPPPPLRHDPANAWPPAASSSLTLNPASTQTTASDSQYPLSQHPHSQHPHLQYPLVAEERLVPVPTQPITPAVCHEPPVPESAEPAPTGRYGHDRDYRWLRGTLDRHYRGTLYLRYAHPSEDDPYGGKVRLEPDDRLSEFADGACLLVEGTLVLPSADADAESSREHFPRYRIQSVRLVDCGD